MRAFMAITMESFTRLRRDRIFRPILVFGFVFILFCSLVSGWSLEEFKKILFDLSSFGFELIGVAVALLWGTKIISDAKSEGSIELQLASSINRSTWLLGKYMGLVIGLALISLTLMALWQGVLWFYGFDVFIPIESYVFLLITLEWFILGAVAIFFSTLTSQPLALFSSFSLWIVGLIVAPVIKTLPAETPHAVKLLLVKIASFWDLGRLHIVDRVIDGTILPGRDVNLRILYALCLIGIIMSVSSLIFRTRDMV